MRIINASWERRNFDMDAYEIQIDKEDLLEFETVLEKIHKQNFKNAYVVIKLPVGNLKALHALEDEGFRFLETQLHFKEHFKAKNSKPRIKGKLSKERLEKDKEAWEGVISKISPGMFDSDRVSLDPALSQEIACKRYQNWCRDLFYDKHTYMMLGKLDDEVYGFCLCKEDEQGINALLVGVFPKFKHLKLGQYLLDDLRGTRLTTTSSNNPAAFKVYQKSGLIVQEQNYVLRKIY
ncbi:hypothetical protein [Campylobacter troglodytis]|uniref:hypothetical protein n=1 Tax=Campylobacter troglodytis TaxID=654363 RepID=UPI001158A1A2|nr:hypothetical protein [Campylobacter troglodytis]TQR53059.1 hypothetical protein DMC01_12205 [Campylobacter troglodytis]